MISCKTCDHYEEYLKDGYVMRCKDVDVYSESDDSEGCVDHTNPDKEKPTHQEISCTKCGHSMRIEG